MKTATIYLPPQALRLPLDLNNRLAAYQVRGSFYSGHGQNEVWWKGEVRVEGFLAALAYVEKECQARGLCARGWCYWVRRQLQETAPAPGLSREEWRARVREATLARDEIALRSVVEAGRAAGFAR